MKCLVLGTQNKLINGWDPRFLGYIVAVSRLGRSSGRFKRLGAHVSIITMISILLQRGG